MPTCRSDTNQSIPPLRESSDRHARRWFWECAMRKPMGSVWDGPENFSTTNAGCVEWKWCKTKGYGIVRVGGKTKQVHRMVLEKKIGRVLKPVECACHTCDNPACCNPEHLWIGSKGDNIRDSVAKGRFPCGESHYQCKLSTDKAQEIRSLHAGGVTQTEIARRFRVSLSLVNGVVNGYRWAS